MHDFGGPESLRYEEVATPTPEADEVLIDVEACGVNRMDSELVKGEYGNLDIAEFWFGDVDLFPHIPGIEPAGVVSEVGEDVTRFEAGDRVVAHSQFTCGECKWCTRGLDNACPEIAVLGVQTPGLGGYAEQIALPEENVLALPDGITTEQAASTCVQFGTAWYMMRRVGLKPGDTLLVTGASGGVGHALTQIGSLTGATVIGTTTSESKQAFIADHGADHVVHAPHNEFAEEVHELTDGAGVDVVGEAVGGATWSESIESLGMRGQLILCGAHSSLEAGVNLGNLFGKQIELVGTTRAPRYAMEETIRLIAEGAFEPDITERYALEDAGEALQRMEDADHVGKMVLTT
ncbi:quinone oxidoreductase family protein [Halorarius halobius]|uniref:quinone oxidoreductase family protein n=1 Tax=Halorarius halobius TaxID=2962671 RepID=UPI0020CD2374|nr:alcohol dehydrogenase catalytic domain-containing protein [Halorarius halobius]